METLCGKAEKMVCCAAKKNAKKGAKSAIYQKIQTWGARVAREKGREGLKKQILGAKWISLREIGSQKRVERVFKGVGCVGSELWGEERVGSPVCSRVAPDAVG